MKEPVIEVWASIDGGYPRKIDTLSLEAWNHQGPGCEIMKPPVLSWGVDWPTTQVTAANRLWTYISLGPEGSISFAPIEDNVIDLCSAKPSCGLPDEECGCRAKNCPGVACWKCGKA